MQFDDFHRDISKNLEDTTDKQLEVKDDEFIYLPNVIFEIDSLTYDQFKQVFSTIYNLGEYFSCNSSDQDALQKALYKFSKEKKEEKLRNISELSKEELDKIIHLYLNGYNSFYIANRYTISVDELDEVLSNIKNKKSN